MSSRYGYGMMNATAMIQLASIWRENVPPQHTCHSFSAHFNECAQFTNVHVQCMIDELARSISCREFTEQFAAEIYSDGCVRNSSAHVRQLEHVVLLASLAHKFRGDMRIVLESPRGTRSEMLPTRLLDTRLERDSTLSNPWALAPDGHLLRGFLNWPFMSVQFWGEHPAGAAPPKCLL